MDGVSWFTHFALLFNIVSGVGGISSSVVDDGQTDWIRYRAAVVEYSPFTADASTSDDAMSVKLRNAEKYTDFAIQAGRDSAQIVVFPEYGLFGPVLRSRADTRLYAETVPETGACIPSGSSSGATTLSVLKQAAIKSGLVLVFHMAEASGSKLYSTQVALSPSGCVLGKYHKYHLYGESGFFDQPDQPEVVTFDTSFGVRFGMFVCFDIMFGAPESIARARGISNFVFSSWWVNFPPLLLATQIQSAWAATMQANLLAANAGSSGWHGSGSGIYGFAPAAGDVKRLQRDLYHNASMAQGTGALLVDDVHSPSLGALLVVDAGAASHPQEILGSNRSSSPLMEIAVTALVMGEQQYAKAALAKTNGLVCSATIHPISSSGSESITWSLVAVGGRYHGLFELEMCAIVPCFKPDLACIDSFGSSRAGLVVHGAVAIAASFAHQNTTLAFATRESGLLVDDTELQRPNATAVVVATSAEPLFAVAVANRVYQGERLQQERMKNDVLDASPNELV